MADKVKEKVRIYREDVEKSYVHTNPKPNTERPSSETIKPKPAKPAPAPIKETPNK